MKDNHDPKEVTNLDEERNAMTWEIHQKRKQKEKKKHQNDY